MRKPYYTPKVRLIGEDWDVYAVMGKTIKALQKAGADREYTDKYMNEAMSGDYDHLLGVTMEYVDVC